MNRDLKIIKKKYGENMAKLCRELFPSLLETEGLLSQLLLTKFEPNHNLYQDIIKQKKVSAFKDYIYSLVDVENNNKIKVYKTPTEYLEEAGYDLYECKTEEDIQSFKKYYAQGEELCTFNGGRLNECFVFFAVKKDVAKIRRENFKFPNRQDEYGTSVLSIQFTKDKTHTLSIKNRYNHHVNNPDATFSNNLDNIIEGLTESFAQEYGLAQQHNDKDFELDGYVKARDGKYYKYNLEINNVYYCPNNIIIDNFEVKRFEKEKYLIFDYFVLDLVNKKIELYDKSLGDSFPNTFENIQKIDIRNTQIGKEVNILTKDNKEIVIGLNKDNLMVKFANSNIEEIKDNFLLLVSCLQELYLPNLKIVGNDFLYFNKSLLELSLPNLQKVGDNFLRDNEYLQKISLPKLQTVGDSFLEYNNALLELNLPNLQQVDSYFLMDNRILKILNLPSLCVVHNYFLKHNNALLEINLPNLITVGHYFMAGNQVLKNVNLPKLQIVGDKFLIENDALLRLDLPALEIVGNEFLGLNLTLQEVILGNLSKVGKGFLRVNNSLQTLYLPNLLERNYGFLSKHPTFNAQNWEKELKLRRKKFF